ncbi:MAG: ABC transporter permease [Opitutaceae bacterium]|jgi:putative ABC transport system permease protein|nr:ABC transporter permease [Opitutaceae bacterium]
MIFLETLRMAFSSLRANLLRSLLTILGMAIGVFSIIGAMTIIDGIRSTIESGLNILGSNSFQIQKFPAINFSDPRQRYGNRRDIDYDMAVRFRQHMDPRARVCATIRRGGQTAVFHDRHTNPNVRLNGSDENYLTAFNYDIAAGRGIGPDDVAFARAVCVLGSEIAEKLFPYEDPSGKLIRIGPQTYTVIGVLEEKGASLGQSQDGFVLVPITRWLMVYGRARRSLSINVQAPTQAELPAVQDMAIGAMRLVRGLAPEDPDDFEIFSNDSLIEAFNNIAGVVTIGAFVISGIALVAAGVGVMNIMLVSVTERTREIGVRKSIGAKKTNIMTQFLIESATLALIGGLAGILLGVMIGYAAGFMFGIAINFPWAWAAAGLLVCGGIGLGFGLYPAWKAASLDPIEALRYE